jgi:hypothetical protein
MPFAACALQANEGIICPAFAAEMVAGTWLLRVSTPLMLLPAGYNCFRIGGVRLDLCGY